MMRFRLQLLKTQDAVTQCKIQTGNLTTDHKVKIYLTSPDFSETKIVTWNFHVDDFAKSSYNMTLGRYSLTSLVFFKSIVSLKEVVDVLKGVHNLWLIWIPTNLKL